MNQESQILASTEVGQITAFLDVDTVVTHVSLAFVFGTRLAGGAMIARDLFMQGAIDHIVLTGGRNRHTGVNEAETHLTFLLDAGVPIEQCIVENLSTNTLENVLFALPKIQQRINLSSIDQILVITKWFHSRRSIMTLKRNWPFHIAYIAQSFEPPGLGKQNWWNTQEGVEVILKEWHSIPLYLGRDHIAPISWNGNSWE